MKNWMSVAGLIVWLYPLSLSAEMLFYENFEDGNFGARWHQLQFNGNPMESVTPSGFKAREGSKVGKFHYVGKSKRVELARPKAKKYENGFIPDGSEVWFGGSFLVPSSMGSKGSGLVQQWHGGPCSNCKSGQSGVPLCLILKGTKLYLNNAHIDKKFLGGDVSTQIKHDQWTDVVIHMKWSRKNDGLCEFWAGKGPLHPNDTPIFSKHNIATLGRHDRDASRIQKDVYVKIGFYYGPSGQKLYWDAVRLGESFAEVAPGRGGTDIGQALRRTVPARRAMDIFPAMDARGRICTPGHAGIPSISVECTPGGGVRRTAIPGSTGGGE